MRSSLWALARQGGIVLTAAAAGGTMYAAAQQQKDFGGPYLRSTTLIPTALAESAAASAEATASRAKVCAERRARTSTIALSGFEAVGDSKAFVETVLGKALKQRDSSLAAAATSPSGEGLQIMSVTGLLALWRYVGCVRCPGHQDAAQRVHHARNVARTTILHASTRPAVHRNAHASSYLRYLVSNLPGRPLPATLQARPTRLARSPGPWTPPPSTRSMKSSRSTPRQAALAAQGPYPMCCTNRTVFPAVLYWGNTRHDGHDPHRAIETAGEQRPTRAHVPPSCARRWRSWTIRLRRWCGRPSARPRSGAWPWACWAAAWPATRSQAGGQTWPYQVCGGAPRGGGRGGGARENLARGPDRGLTAQGGGCRELRCAALCRAAVCCAAPVQCARRRR